MGPVVHIVELKAVVLKDLEELLLQAVVVGFLSILVGVNLLRNIKELKGLTFTNRLRGRDAFLKGDLFKAVRLVVDIQEMQRSLIKV